MIFARIDQDDRESNMLHKHYSQCSVKKSDHLMTQFGGFRCPCGMLYCSVNDCKYIICPANFSLYTIDSYGVNINLSNHNTCSKQDIKAAYRSVCRQECRELYVKIRLLGNLLHPDTVRHIILMMLPKDEI